MAKDKQKMEKLMSEKLKESGFDFLTDLSEPHIGTAIKYYREKFGRRAADVAKRSGINPGTLAAIETGRIKNPSIRNIQAIAKALGVSPAEFFEWSELRDLDNVYQGTQKGEFHVDFPNQGYKLISFTPRISDFFIGKVVMSRGAKIERKQFEPARRIFIQVILGKLTASVHGRDYSLKEGSHFLVNTRVPFSFRNDSLRDSSFLIVTAPSFVGLSPDS